MKSVLIVALLPFLAILTIGCQTTTTNTAHAPAARESQTPARKNQTSAKESQTSARVSPTFEDLLNLSKEVDPQADLNAARIQFTTIVNQVKDRLGLAKTPRESIAAISFVLYEQHKMTVTPDALVMSADTFLDPSKSEFYAKQTLLLPYVLTKKRGYCLSFTALYVAIGESLGLPIFPVLVPKHVFARYDDGKDQLINIETLAQGKETSNSYYVNAYGISPAALERHLYLDTIRNPKALSALFWRNLANVEVVHNRDNEASQYIARYEAVFPNETAALQIRAVLALRKGDAQIAKELANKILSTEPDYTAAYFILGVAHLASNLSESRRNFERAARGGDEMAVRFAHTAWLHENPRPMREPQFFVNPPPNVRAAVFELKNPKGFYTLKGHGKIFLFLDKVEEDFASNIIFERFYNQKKSKQHIVANLRSQSLALLPQLGLKELQAPECVLSFRYEVEKGKAIVNCIQLIFSGDEVFSVMLSAPETYIAYAKSEFMNFVVEIKKHGKL